MIRLVACADLMITLYTRRGEFTIHWKKCTVQKIHGTGSKARCMQRCWSLQLDGSLIQAILLAVLLIDTCIEGQSD